ncbi:unnamed protein product [Vicia faba]|uniref:RING-type E3 ubiquitin transferase n=1 Tax=Vicia faba TaxID=3906 RepID=A0AAV1BBI1_VICFA|nr:unnamed protein product [Vicia faba]
MYASTSFTSRLHHDLLVDSHTRRLLLQLPIDSNVGMILTVLLCTFICSLALISIVRCALRFSNAAINNGYASSSSSNSSPQLVNKGIKKKALRTFPTASYSTELKLPGLDTECMICLSEFTKGEKVRILPKCNHGFHVGCIDEWLKEHSSCPKCRQCLLETCPKIGGSQVQPIVLPVPEITIRIQPLDHEAVELNYREESR